MRSWKENVGKLSSALTELQITDSKKNTVEHNNAFNDLVKEVIELRENARTMYFIGNGASASMSSHMSADFGKNARIHTETFTDLALITAMANDISYDEVFSIPLKFRAKENDMLVAISSSGKSPNILNAIKIAQDCNMRIVTLSGMQETNPLRQSGHYNFYINATEYGDIETSHAAILHYWKDLVE